MFTTMLAAYGFLMSPAPELTHVPLRHVPRMLQGAGIPGSAPAPLPNVPAVLRVFVTPPPPAAPYVVVCTNIGAGWRGISPEGWTVGVRPYIDRSWSQSAVDAAGNMRQGFHVCYVVMQNGVLLKPSAHLWVTSAAPYAASGNFPDPLLISPGWTFAVGQ